MLSAVLLTTSYPAAAAARRDVPVGGGCGRYGRHGGRGAAGGAGALLPPACDHCVFMAPWNFDCAEVQRPFLDSLKSRIIVACAP